MRKLIATVFNYSHDGLLADEAPSLGNADPNRARILHAFSLTEELCVCDLALLVGMGQSAVSHQLRLENYYLSPRLSAKTMKLNAGVAFGAALAGGAVGGFVGAFFALPIAGTIQAFMATYAKGYTVVDSALTHVDAKPSPALPKKSGHRCGTARNPMRMVRPGRILREVILGSHAARDWVRQSQALLDRR